MWVYRQETEEAHTWYFEFPNWATELNWTEEVESKSTDKSGTSGGAGGRNQRQVVSIAEFGEGSQIYLQ